MIENSFGILAARWRIFRRPIIANPDNAVAFSKAAIMLHNYLRTHVSSIYCPPGFVDGEDSSGNVVVRTWREEEPATGIKRTSSTGSNRLDGIDHEVDIHIQLLLMKAFKICSRYC